MRVKLTKLKLFNSAGRNKTKKEVSDVSTTFGEQASAGFRVSVLGYGRNDNQYLFSA